MKKDSDLTRLRDYIKETLPWAHGHQVKALTAFVAALLQEQTGNQAQLARTQGKQEAGCKRLARLLHNDRLHPKWLAEAVCRQALSQLPRAGQVRFTIDWTSEGEQHLLVVSLVVGRRAVPVFWRAYRQDVLKGRMGHYEVAVVKRAFKLIFESVPPRRVRLTADRGFADTALFELLDSLGVRFVIRVKSSTKVCLQGAWVNLHRVGFGAGARRRNLGRVLYCESSPHQLWVTISRARNKKGQWERWHLVSNRRLAATRMAQEYGHRFACEEGFRDAKWYLGFKRARVAAITAWSRLFALFALALLALTTLGTFLLLAGNRGAPDLLRRVASRRRGRCELSLVAATLSLLKQSPDLLNCLLPWTKLNLQASLANVS
jgi:hypothetical protein